MNFSIYNKGLEWDNEINFPKLYFSPTPLTYLQSIFNVTDCKKTVFNQAIIFTKKHMSFEFMCKFYSPQKYEVLIYES